MNAGETEFYYGAAEQALGLIFSVSPRPEEACEHIVKHALRRLFSGRACTQAVGELRAGHG